MRVVTIVLVLLFSSLTAGAQKRGVDVRMPLVEETLRFVKSQSIFSPSEAELLRAGAVRICGEKFERPGCRPQGVPMPSEYAIGPNAARAWRQILESAMAAESIRQGKKFDKTVFQRFVMDGMVDALNDSNSFYLAPSVYRKIVSIPTKFVGFGLRVVPRIDFLEVGAVHGGSPASRAGLVTGDRIIKVNNLPVNGYHRPLALAAIWGADGNRLTLTIKKREGPVRKVEVVYHSWTFAPYLLERKDGIVIVRIRYFDRGLVYVIKGILSSRTKGLIIDLRDAASGSEEEMVRLADLLIPKGAIGSKKTRSGLGDRTWEAKEGSEGKQPDIKMALVINQGTSGLSEVFASAIRKHNRAILVGSITAGQDTQETLRPFNDGSAIQVTSMKLFGPHETSLKDGVFPHLETDRSNTVGLATEVVKRATGASLKQLLEAVPKEVSKP
jgi:carboxyl-terminal processing protease